MANKPIQLTTTNTSGQIENVYPYAKPEFVIFSDNKTLSDKINNIGNTHNHNKATVSNDGYMSKEDKAKLDGITNYTHPTNHAASMITQDANNRFVTDTEKNTWNAKASTAVATSSANGLLSKEDKQKIDRISNNFDIVYDSSTETINFRFR